MIRDQSALTNNTHASHKPNMRRKKYKSNAQSDRRIYSHRENRKTNFGNANGWQQHSPRVGINSPSGNRHNLPCGDSISTTGSRISALGCGTNTKIKH
jgi:hypothetical protein